MSYSVSIVMINRDGGEYLRRALRGLIYTCNEARSRGCDIEFVLVDNDSSDNSIEIADRMLQIAEYRWRIVCESEPGVNSARRAGVKAARGRYIIFTDNDLAFAPFWLPAYIDAFHAYPDVRVFAGRVLLGKVEGRLPIWLDAVGLYSRPSIVVRCDNGTEELLLTLGDANIEGPVGPNMALERSIFEEYGSFDTRFGLRPGSLLAGAEAEFFRRLERRGESFVYVPGALVLHPLKSQQISKAYFRKRTRGLGRVLARMQRIEGIQAIRVLGIKRYLFRQLLSAWCDYLGSFLQPCPKRRFYNRCEISKIWGQVEEDFTSRKSTFDQLNLSIGRELTK